MRWVAPTEKDTANQTLEKRLWAAAPVFFVDQGLLREGAIDVERDFPRNIKNSLDTVATYGVRAMPVIKAHEHTRPAYARVIGQRLLQRALYIRNTYEFKIGIRFSLLEPMDLLTLTDASLGLDLKLVRIVSIAETEHGEISIVAEETLVGTAESALYDTQGSAGFEHDYNVAPGNTNPAVIFEAPGPLALNGLEIWLAASGGYNWGGCEVWVSNDDMSYQRAGAQQGPARYGESRSAVAVQPEIDAMTHLSLDLTASAATLASAGAEQPVRRATLSYLGGEFISYRSSELISTYIFLMTDLRRGLYGSTIAAHVIGSPFVPLPQQHLVGVQACQVGRNRGEFWCRQAQACGVDGQGE